MIEQLAPVIAVPATVAAAWAGIALRLQGNRMWSTGALVAAGLTGTLIVIAAYLPLIGFFGTLGVPALSVGAGILLMLVFTKAYALAAAAPVPLAFLVVLQPPVYPLVLPLIVVLPVWVSGWIERPGNAGGYALALVASLVVVPLVVYGLFFVMRGP